MNTQEIYSKYFRPGNISTDSRKIETGTIFVALKGDHFNGNEFAAAAIESGAAIAVVDEPVDGPAGKIIRVDNTLKFLQELATLHRKKYRFKIIGLTGSNGKTTTKELIHSVLSIAFKVQSTQGNLNNHIGVPLTLLSLKSDTEIGIVEMGANHPGEINDLCDIAQPDSGLITNIGKAHLEGFNGFEGVIRAKSELYNYLKLNRGKIYFNKSDKLLSELVGDYKNIQCYGTDSCNCSAEILSSVPALELNLRTSEKIMFIVTRMYGDYNLSNILAAACIGIDLGMSPEDVKKGIESYMPSNLRSQIMHIGTSVIIMDCYNANPSSMHEALNSMSKFTADNKIVILGGMKELGNESAAEHDKVGQLLGKMHFEKIFLYGPEFHNIKLKNSFHTDSFDELTAHINSTDLKNKIILVKGSRSNRLERLGKVFHDYYLPVR